MFSWACSASHSASTCRAQHWPACARFRVFSSRHCRRCKITQNQDKSFSSWLAAARSRISWFALKEFYFWTLKRRFVWQAQGILHPAKSEEKREFFVAFPKMMAGVGHLKRICKDAFSVAGAVQETCSSEMLGGQAADFLRRVAFWTIRSSGLGRWFSMTGAAVCMTWHHFFVAGAAL